MIFVLVHRVVDLGVMTPCEKILQRAMEENAGKISMLQLICFFLTFLDG